MDNTFQIKCELGKPKLGFCGNRQVYDDTGEITFPWGETRVLDGI